MSVPFDSDSIECSDWLIAKIFVLDQICNAKSWVLFGRLIVKYLLFIDLPQKSPSEIIVRIGRKPEPFQIYHSTEFSKTRDTIVFIIRSELPKFTLKYNPNMILKYRYSLKLYINFVLNSGYQVEKVFIFITSKRIKVKWLFVDT